MMMDANMRWISLLPVHAEKPEPFMKLVVDFIGTN